jgi:hypothetical protein
MFVRYCLGRVPSGRACYEAELPCVTSRLHGIGKYLLIIKTLYVTHVHFQGKVNVLLQC